jgi:1,4-alpha-glucan branching enzyme
MEMKLGLIAAIAYSINVAYCASMGDEQLSWNDAPEGIKKGIEAGVEFHLNNPNTTPEQSHEEWLKDKEQNGWVYGETKDLANKTHLIFYRMTNYHQNSVLKIICSKL